MSSLHFFFRCYHCGAWHQSKGRIKQKRCVMCNRVFQFKASNKIKQKCTDLEAVKIIKHLKSNER